MTLAAQRKQMVDYLFEQLKGSAETVIPTNKKIIPGINSSYILVDNDGIVLLLDKKYSKNDFKQVYNGASAVKRNIAAVVLKDETTFFRYAFRGQFSKSRYRKSMNTAADIGFFCNNYEHENKLMLQPEEVFIAFKKAQGVQYFRPGESPALETFRFSPARLDYSYFDSGTRIKPRNRDSKRIFSFTQIGENPGNIILKNNYLVRVPSQKDAS